MTPDQLRRGAALIRKAHPYPSYSQHSAEYAVNMAVYRLVEAMEQIANEDAAAQATEAPE